jgi:hypothetical protein
VTNVAVDCPGLVRCLTTTCGTGRVGARDVTVDVPLLTFTGVSGDKVGRGLQLESSVIRVHLDAPVPQGGVTVTIASEDASLLLISKSRTEVPVASIAFDLAPGATETPFFYVHAPASAALNFSSRLRATATGYQTGFSPTLLVVQGHVSVGTTPTGASSLAATVSVGETDEFSVYTGIGTGGMTGQPVSAAALPCTVSSSDVLVGQVRTASTSGASVGVSIAAGQSASPATVATGGVAFDGLSSGVTNVAVDCPGLVRCLTTTCGTGRVGARNVTVN